MTSTEFFTQIENLYYSSHTFIPTGSMT